MKKITLLIFAASVFSGCANKTELKEKEPIEAEQNLEELVTDSLAFYTEPFVNLVKTTDGVFRGVRFGMPVDTVKLLEDPSDLQEESTAQLDYIVNYNLPETAEVIYRIDKEAVTGIDVYIYNKNPESRDNMQKELRQFFLNRYGEPKEKTSSLRWRSRKENLIVEVTERDKQDLQIHFEYPE